MVEASAIALADLDKLEQVLDKEGAIEMCQMFLEDTKDIILRISQSIESRDCEQIRAVAHMLKGCCKSVAALSTADLCAQMEAAAREGDIRQAVSFLPAIANTYGRLECQLREYLAAN